MTPLYASEDADLHRYEPAMPLVFLDIDGVLNNHRFDPQAMSSSIEADCVARLNGILAITSARVVVSSAWRYLVHNGRMIAHLGTRKELRNGIAGIDAEDQ